MRSANCSPEEEDKMSTHVELSGRDETLANALYTGAAPITRSGMQFVRFDYVIHHPSRDLLESVAANLGVALDRSLPADHRALLAQRAEQSPEDLVVAERMQNVQRHAATQ
jgi:hypothetical protein